MMAFFNSYIFLSLEIHYIERQWLIGLEGRVFDNGPGNPRSRHTKDLKEYMLQKRITAYCVDRGSNRRQLQFGIFWAGQLGRWGLFREWTGNTYSTAQLLIFEYFVAFFSICLSNWHQALISICSPCDQVIQFWSRCFSDWKLSYSLR